MIKLPSGLSFGIWNLFVIWPLLFGASIYISAFLFSLFQQAKPVKIEWTRCNLVQTPVIKGFAFSDTVN